ncbi:hypothetical protein F4810DRAFT_713348 [Camillea tinctor]|nr:hypothetical protein F4810DRAFT_713348 [Camillea tinctor]
MSSTTTETSFPNFPKLPAELRIQIWEEALSEWSVWAPVLGLNADDRTKRHPFYMTFVGATPNRIGAVSAEARELMGNQFEHPICSKDGTRVYWVDLEKTVVYLGDYCELVAVVSHLRPDDLERFRHVALLLYEDSEYDKIFWFLSKSCLDLKTITIQLAPGREPGLSASRRALLPYRAEYFLSLAQNPRDDAIPESFKRTFQLVCPD